MNKKSQIIKLRNQGFTYEKIGKYFGGLSRQRIHQIITDYKPFKILKLSKKYQGKESTYRINGKYRRICKTCGQLFLANRSFSQYCSLKCRKSYSEYCNKLKNIHTENRKKVLVHYGGDPPECKKCGYNKIECLTIDHLYNNGSQERKKIGSGSQMYQWLIEKEFPKGYQVLCWNCNWLKYLEYKKVVQKP